MHPFLSINIKKELHTAEGKFPLTVKLAIEKGEFLALTGSSGGGKTTLLRLIAGLEKSEEGQIIFDKKTWSNTTTNQFIAPQKRSIGFVFQDYALFPNMTIQQNLAFALDQNADKNRVGELMELMELTALANRFPQKLSGGQQQRVALARALVRQPKILLLDEPLSALDTAMRQRLQDDLKRLHETYDLTTILISHDEREIFKLANRVICIENGQVKKIGTPSEVLKDKGIFGKVQSLELEGNLVKITYKTNGELLTISLPKSRAVSYKIGQNIFIS
ncbi:MAG: molybdate transport system ATP-binding protein [Paraglaciecola sp.]|jgi:molybdate transport system ATP-binding protein